MALAHRCEKVIKSDETWNDMVRVTDHLPSDYPLGAHVVRHFDTCIEVLNPMGRGIRGEMLTACLYDAFGRRDDLVQILDTDVDLSIGQVSTKVSLLIRPKGNLLRGFSTTDYALIASTSSRERWKHGDRDAGIIVPEYKYRNGRLLHVFILSIREDMKDTPEKARKLSQITGKLVTAPFTDVYSFLDPFGMNQMFETMGIETF